MSLGKRSVADNLQSILILPKSQSSQLGFTLTELLVGMVITTIVVGMAGTGLIYMMSSNTKSDAQITQQTNLRRAADFVADEVKTASVLTTTDPVWITGGFTTGINPVGTSPSPVLYLEIPMPIENVASNVLTVQNHGLAKGNAVRFSGSSFPSGMTNTTTYYVKTTPDANTFTVVTSAGTDVSFSTIPQNFAVRRLVVYYTAIPDATKWKAPMALYRATGNCTASGSTTYTSDAINCLVMVDSLATTSAFSAIISSKQATLNFNGQLCTPSSMANTCTSPTQTSVSINAVARATLQ